MTTTTKVSDYTKCQEGWTVLVFGPFCWGKGKSLREAFANCRKNSPSKGSPYYPKNGPRYVAYIAPDAAEARVTDMGGLAFKGEVEPICIGEV